MRAISAMVIGMLGLCAGGCGSSPRKEPRSSAQEFIDQIRRQTDEAMRELRVAAAPPPSAQTTAPVPRVTPSPQVPAADNSLALVEYLRARRAHTERMTEELRQQSEREEELRRLDDKKRLAKHDQDMRDEENRLERIRPEQQRLEQQYREQAIEKDRLNREAIARADAERTRQRALDISAALHRAQERDLDARAAARRERNRW